MAQSKDYYEILGVGKNATSDEIKNAYRKLAREHHPDMVGASDKDAAEKRFKEINEAYQVLIDPQKRKMYDQFGHTAGYSQGGANAGYNPFSGFSGGNWGPFTYSYSTNSGGAEGDFDPFDIFEDFFGFRGYSGKKTPRKGKNLYYEILIDFKDAVSGIEKEVNVESGKLKIKIPAGVHDGTEIKYSSKGMPGPEGAPAGDLFLTIRVKMPNVFERVGDTLVSSIEIDMVQAALGDDLEITVVEESKKDALGKKKLKIPAGTQSGTQFRVKGVGMPRINSSGRGDLVVRVFVKIPEKLSRDQKKILEEYRKTL